MKKRRISSSTKQKILLLLQAGAVLSLSRSVNQRRSVGRSFGKEWRKIDRQYLYRVLNEFRHDRLIDYEEQTDGQIKIVLTAEGKERTLQFDLDKLTIPTPPRWDGKWRLVFFDIPETNRRGRNALRHKLRELGFYEWQKSVFVYPHHCRDEIDFVVEFFNLRHHVRYGELLSPTNEAELKLHFDL
ncbi:MAG: CRISPR-associated endonuclease Cas2 [Candidatus Vogelbacteria bacterium]|nr:CRISPR-associated endonuclease Cas2 [Candidatus Vogelbacteria bacterium]